MTDIAITQLDPEPDWHSPIFIAPGYRVGNLVILSGQGAINPDTREVVGVGDFDAQAAQTMANLSRVLSTAGADRQDIIKVTIYVTDMVYYPQVLTMRERYFSPPYPADTIVEVRALALPECLLEIDAIAITGAGSQLRGGGAAKGGG